ncbi:MAG: ATP-binding protein [Candidatus Phosphoribacter sp.]
MSRGRLRIYLGAAPGVGKTVAMLSEGARRAARGTDVVVALCETHGREHTVRMSDGLEVVPRRSVAYRGAILQEMDLDAVLDRRPKVALVDELAHTNAPGSRHEKRWEDIEELLDAGIDVISTVNIQHLESLNDVVTAITGVTQQETVPDHVVRAADQIELVDMSPEALRRRMAHGNIYRAEKIDAALSNYFRVGNLGALRELALLWLADRVDEAVERYRGDHGITGSWPTRERVVVAVCGSSGESMLLRRGARIAGRGAGGELHAVYMARTDGLAGPSVPDVAELRTLTEELGGTFHTVTGEDAAAAVLDFARALNATQVVVGASRRPAWRRLMRAGTAESVIAESRDIDVLVVRHPDTGRARTRRTTKALSVRRVRIGALLALLVPLLLTVLLSSAPAAVGLPLIMLVYLFATVVVALVGGLWPALAAAVFSSLLINWFFTPPVRTLTIADPEHSVALLVFVGIATAVSSVVNRSARQTAAALGAQQESAALAELTHTLLGSTDQMALLLRRAVDMFGAESAAVVARPTKEHQQPDVIDATDGFALPANPELSTREAVDDEHDLVLVGAPLPADRQRLLAAYAVHAGAILHRRSLQHSAGDAESLARDNRARTALLSAVSHDLRTPLSAIKAAIGSLRSDEVTFSHEDEAELMAIIEESADRLEALIGNLLDMSRLQVGALVARSQVVDLGEVVPQVVSTLAQPQRVRWELTPDARDVWADAGLLDRVLGNVLENALRHAPAATQIRVTSSRIGPAIQVWVVDTGPGVDEALRERMFLPFQRSGDAPAGEGVGLGLAVARGLTEAMGGTIEAEDTPGGGLTMIVTLPAARAPEPLPPDPASAARAVPRTQEAS